MRVLLDESFPKKFATLIPNHDVSTVVQMGWQGTVNGALLQQAIIAGFAALITLDQSMEYQQDVANL